MRIPWTARQRNEDILEEVGGRKLWSSVISRKLRYFGHIMRKEDDNLEKCIITGMVEGTVVEVDLGGRGAMTSRTGHIYQQTSCCSRQKDRAGWRSLVCRAANVCTSE